MDPKSYQPYRNLPPIAGICTMEEAMAPGLSVEACVARLKRYHYAFKRLHEIWNARITSEPVYELKMAYSLHSHLAAEHVSALRKRVAEMREPPLKLDVVPDAKLEMFFDEIRGAESTEEYLLGLYGKAVPALRAALESHVADTNRLVDHPSVRICRFALLELGDIEAFGERAVANLIDEGERARAESWLALLDDCLAAAGGLSGSREPKARELEPRYSAQPFEFPRVPVRDGRFDDPYNMGVNAEAFLYDERFPPQPKTLMMFYKRLREIDVPEMMASIIAETLDKPWDYYRDMTRQLWDEARHAIMGEVGFVNLGVDWTKVKINFTFSLALNTQLSPLERHAVLYFIEQGLMPKTGKRFEWEVGVASENPLAALFQDYDWADEVLHARIGRDWYVSQMPSVKEATGYGDKCWSRVLMNWADYREKGLTHHANWWPAVYKEACERWGIDPDPEVLAFNTSYENTRADLKDVSVSG